MSSSGTGASFTMKPISICITATATVLSVTSLLSQQTVAIAQSGIESLTPAQRNHISGGITRFNTQDFFQQGREQMEQQVSCLAEGKNCPNEATLEINDAYEAQLEQEFQGSSNDWPNSPTPLPENTR